MCYRRLGSQSGIDCKPKSGDTQDFHLMEQENVEMEKGNWGTSIPLDFIIFSRRHIECLSLHLSGNTLDKSLAGQRITKVEDL